jgi:hypothetical protein
MGSVLNIRVEAMGVSLAFSIADGAIAIAPAKDAPPGAVPNVRKPPRSVAANGATPPGGVIDLVPALDGYFKVAVMVRSSCAELRWAAERFERFVQKQGLRTPRFHMPPIYLSLDSDTRGDIGSIRGAWRWRQSLQR